MTELDTRESHIGGRRIVTLVVAGLVCLPSLGWGQAQSQAAKELSKAFSSAAKAAMPAVVSVKVEKTLTAPAAGLGGPEGFNDPFGQFNDDFLRKFFGRRLPPQQAPRKYRQEGLGSGFIISEDGYILTNNHVVGDVDKITVELKDGRSFPNAKLIGTDPDTEVALIKIEGENFPVLPMGDSSKLDIGDWVIAIGSPFELSETVTVGVISAVGRNKMGIAAYEDFIQTDAAINPGNSGGPLIDLDGKVIGINTAIASSSGGYMGIGFAIPINMARTIGEQLKKSGKISRGYLGLQAEDVDSEKAELLGLKEAKGVIISIIMNGSPAEKAGLKVNDIILAVNGEKVQSYDAFRKEVALMSPGNKVRLDILRDGKPRTLTATLGDRRAALAKEEPPAEEEPKTALGLEVQDLTKDLAGQLHYKAGEGVLVSGVTPGSPAAEKGIQPGDLIVSVNGHAVTSVDEFTKAVKPSQGGKVLLLVKRGNVSQFVTVRSE
jgi:serine protease Do